MSCTITHRPHRCELPGTIGLPAGTIAKCNECGQEWRYGRILFEFGWRRYPLPSERRDVEDTSKLGDDE